MFETLYSAEGSSNRGELAGVSEWDGGSARAFGSSVSLYERHPVTSVPAGEPIADCFAIVCRQVCSYVYPKSYKLLIKNICGKWYSTIIHQ